MSVDEATDVPPSDEEGSSSESELSSATDSEPDDGASDSDDNGEDAPEGDESGDDDAMVPETAVDVAGLISDPNRGLVVGGHPEEDSPSFDKVKEAARITKVVNGIVQCPNHRTLPYITKFEVAAVIGKRALELDQGAPCLVDTPPEMIDGYSRARKELIEGQTPYIIRRPLPGGTSEYWHVRDLQLSIWATQ